MNLYQILISFLEPTQAVVTIGADTQEEAIQKLQKETETQLSGLEIVSVIELGSVAPTEKPTEPEPAFTPLPDNVIVFPGNNSKH